MNTFEHYLHAKNNGPEARTRGGGRSTLLAVIIVSIFVMTSEAGLRSVSQAGLTSIEILLELCRFVVAAFHIFAR